jgi:hypothetical protein
VANADNNSVAVVDVSAPRGSRVSGFIPTGWYPTAVAFNAEGNTIFILSGKGLTSAPNPRGPQPGVTSFVQEQYTGAMLQGALSLVPMPSAEKLDELTKTVSYHASRRVPPDGQCAGRPDFSSRRDQRDQIRVLCHPRKPRARPYDLERGNRTRTLPVRRGGTPNTRSPGSSRRSTRSLWTPK